MRKQGSFDQSLLKSAELAGYKVEALADLLGISTRHLNRKIACEYGRSTKEFLSELQTGKGLEALRELKHIKDAAMSAGFRNVQHFTRVFKIRYNMTPGQYLRKMF